MKPITAECETHVHLEGFLNEWQKLLLATRSLIEMIWLWCHNPEHWHVLQTIWLPKKSFSLLCWSLVWAVETTILVHFHKPMWEEQEELLNTFSKSQAAVTTGSSCMTVSESPEGHSVMHVSLATRTKPNPPESSKTNKRRMGKYPNTLPWQNSTEA